VWLFGFIISSFFVVVSVVVVVAVVVVVSSVTRPRFMMLLIPTRTPSIIRHRLERTSQSIIEHDNFIHAEYRRRPSDLSSQLGLQLARLGVGDDTSRYGNGYGGIVTGGGRGGRSIAGTAAGGLEFEFGWLGHDPSESMMAVVAMVIIVGTSMIVGVFGALVPARR